MSKISEDRVEALAAACAEKVKQLEFSVKQSAFDSVRQELETELAIARVALLALRERAEPVAWVPQYQLDLLKKSVIVEADLSSMQRFDEVPLYTAPPAPAHVDEIAAQAGIDPAIADAYMQGCHDTGARLSEASGKQPLSVDVLAGALRNAPLAPSDNQGRQRDLVAAGWIACSERMPEKDGNYWAWWSESKRQGPAWFIKSELQAQFQSSEITHWMPLPEAPGKN
ncbi:DUF551 domain-containing protein [Cronobacter dublinensis]